MCRNTVIFKGCINIVLRDFFFLHFPNSIKNLHVEILFISPIYLWNCGLFYLQFEVINGIRARIIGWAGSSSYYIMDSQFGHRGLHKKQKPTIFSFQLCIFCGCHFNSFLFSLIDFVLCVPFTMTSSSFKRHTTQVGSAASINWCKNTIMINCWNLCKLQAF